MLEKPVEVLALTLGGRELFLFPCKISLLQGKDQGIRIRRIVARRRGLAGRVDFKKNPAFMRIDRVNIVRTAQML